MMYSNREEAGNRLIETIEKELMEHTRYVVAAIPNGGVPVALPIAKNFSFPLFVIISRKVQFPWTTESGFGAVTSDGILVFNEEILKFRPMTNEELDIQVSMAKKEVISRERDFNRFLLPEQLNEKVVLLVDDGLASGITTRASISSIERRGAKGVILCVPTAHKNSIKTVENLGKRDFHVKVVSPDIRSGFSFAVANAYEHWHDENSQDILKLLEDSAPISLVY